MHWTIDCGITFLISNFENNIYLRWNESENSKMWVMNRIQKASKISFTINDGMDKWIDEINYNFHALCSDSTIDKGRYRSRSQSVLIMFPLWILVDLLFHIKFHFFRRRNKHFNGLNNSTRLWRSSSYLFQYCMQGDFTSLRLQIEVDCIFFICKNIIYQRFYRGQTQ